MIRPTWLPPADDLITIDEIEPSSEVRAKLRGQTVVLAFSRGKDSIAAWLALAADGITVKPFYRYGIPGLRYVEESLTYFEQAFGTPILRVPHVSVYRQLNNHLYQPPERTQVIAALQLPDLDYRDINDMVCEHYGLDPKTTWFADGVRASDSPDRRRALSMYGPFNAKEMHCRVVWDWRTKHCWQAMEAAGIERPPDYAMWPRSLDGIGYDYIDALRVHYPDDYATVLRWYPLADVDHFRRHHLSRRHPKLKERPDAA